MGRWEEEVRDMLCCLAPRQVPLIKWVPTRFVPIPAEFCLVLT